MASDISDTSQPKLPDTALNAPVSVSMNFVSLIHVRFVRLRTLEKNVAQRVLMLLKILKSTISIMTKVFLNRLHRVLSYL